MNGGPVILARCGSEEPHLARFEFDEDPRQIWPNIGGSFEHPENASEKKSLSTIALDPSGDEAIIDRGHVRRRLPCRGVVDERRGAAFWGGLPEEHDTGED